MNLHAKTLVHPGYNTGAGVQIVAVRREIPADPGHDKKWMQHSKRAGKKLFSGSSYAGFSVREKRTSLN